MKLIPGPFWLLWKAFVVELSHLYQAYANCSSLQSVALKACSIFVALTLQKPNRSSNSKDHVAHLNCRLALWKGGNLSALLDEGQCIQRHPRNSVVLQIRIELHEISITWCYRERYILPFVIYLVTHLVVFCILMLRCLWDPQNGDTEMTTVRRVLLDKYPHYCLFVKLEAYGIRGKLLEWI